MEEVNLEFNYDFDDDNSIGTSYDETCELYANGTTNGEQDVIID